MDSELILYTTEDGVTKVDVTFVDETVWLTQEQMADLFQKSKSTINEHIKNIYSDGELNENSTMRKFGNSEFSTKPTNYYNLDKLTVTDYNEIEKNLRKELKDKFDSAKNGQLANDKALKMVKAVYEPIIKAIDPGYTVCIEFK